MKMDVVIAGVGGQGNIFASIVISQFAMNKKLNVLGAETIGAAQRGGSVVSHIRIAESAIYSPLISRGQADLLIGMEYVELLRHLRLLNPKGAYLVNAIKIPTVQNNMGLDEYPETDEILKAAKKYCPNGHVMHPSWDSCPYCLEMQQAMGGPGGLGGMFGGGKKKPVDPETVRVTFADVAGIDEVKGEITEIVDYLRAPEKYRAIGARPPKGVLLTGAPGTGKTLLARAVAGEAGVAFFSISASQFIEMFVGIGASRVRDLFTNAKKAAPSIIFIDELDAVGRSRGAGFGGGHDEREQTLNQLLSWRPSFPRTSSRPVS